MQKCYINKEDIPMNVSYYINNQKTIFYILDEENNVIHRVFSSEFDSFIFNAYLQKKEDEDIAISKKMSVKEILKFDTPQVKNVLPICSTIKPNGYFHESFFGGERMFLNEFLGGDMFINALKNNNFKTNKKDILTLFEEKCPATFLLIKNLFYNESDEVILNFFNWLNKVCFTDERQDVMYLFFGTDEKNQGQGAGKGVLISILSLILNGLITQVDNSTYNSRFNSDIMNKKIVFFDEISFKTLLYEALKNITGNSKLRIEHKGKEPILIDNISNWLLFTNECNLYNKITIDDRRTFLIRPNPTNGSLKKLYETNYKSFSNFEKTLFEEKENFLHIIALCNGDVKNPIELQTNAKKDYFEEQEQLKKEDFKNFEELLVNEKLFNSVVEEIKERINIEENNKLKAFCKYKVLDKETFSIIHNLFHDKLKIISEKSDILLFREIIKKAEKNGFIYKQIQKPKTIKYKKYKSTLLIKTNISKYESNEIFNLIRTKITEETNKEHVKNNNIKENENSDTSFFPYNSKEEFLEAHGF